MRTIALLVPACLMLFACAAPAPADDAPPASPSLEAIRETVAGKVQLLLACRQSDGSFVLGRPTDKALVDLYPQYPVGQTALAVLALQYARPHLKGELQTKATSACRDGIAWIVQRAPEPRTYTAGLALTVLYQASQANPDRYRRLIDAYATMLVTSQHPTAETMGTWGYFLNFPPPGWEGQRLTADFRGDKSNTQFALLGLYNAQRSGFQVPRSVWERSAEHYVKAQSVDGGWGYAPQLRPQPYANMTLAGTISLELCIEMALVEGHKQCKPLPRAKPVDAGLRWLADNWEKGGEGNAGPKGKTGSTKETGEGGVTADAYGLYALERLGILMGRSNIGGHDWYAEGAKDLLANRWDSMFGTTEVTNCFGIAFLSRGLEPIVINKLERAGTGDWNCDPYDAKHLAEFIEDCYQQAVQWRIVTLEAPRELLLRTPILYISGHEKLDFSDAEKAKLKAYVAGGGTILAQTCCGKKEFDASVRALARELFAADLAAFPAKHRIFERMTSGGVAPKAEVQYAALESEQGRPAIIYLPKDFCCRWSAGGPGAREALTVGAGIYLYITNECRQMYLRTHPEPEPQPGR